MAFYFRSHDAGGGAWYFRSNEVRNTQTVTGVDIITDIRSAFFNVDAVPVDGDQVTLPTVFQGSTITLEANGLYTISPALPAGTQIPRTFYDASTDTAYNDYIIVFDDTGEVVTITGSGAIAATGSGQESALGFVSIDSVGTIEATGSGAESASGDVAITSVGTVTASGSSQGVDSGDVLITSVGSIVASGTIVIDPGISGDVVITSVGSIFASGSGGGSSYRAAINRIFVFD